MPNFLALARVEGTSRYGVICRLASRIAIASCTAKCFNPRWLVGAPPSRTNPDGQPGGYPLLDPDQLYSADSPARQLFETRLRKLLSDTHGVRIDHP